MKKCFTLIFILILLLHTSCNKADEGKKNTAIFNNNVIELQKETSNLSFDNNTAYITHNNGIAGYNLYDGEKKSIIDNKEGFTVIFAENDLIYAYNQNDNTVYIINQDGDINKTYNLSAFEIDAQFITASKNWIVIVSSKLNQNTSYPESELYKIDLKSNKINIIEGNFKGSDDYSYIQGICFQNDDTLYITSLPSIGIGAQLDSAYKLYEFDLENEYTINEYNISGTTIYYDKYEKTLFYFEGYNLKKFDTNDEHKRIYRIDDNVFSNYLSEESENKYYATPSDFFVTENNVVFWDSVLKDVFIIETSFSNNNPVVILAPEFYLLKIDDMIKEFESEYQCSVNLITYKNDIFLDKLRLKLLAKESDFDIIIYHENNLDMMTLESILRNELFEPLNNYKGITENFTEMYEGIFEMMSYNDQLFGIPIQPTMLPLAISDEFTDYGYTLPDKNWNFEDLWELCDEIIKSGEKDLGIFQSFLNFMVMCFAQNSVDNNDLNKDELKELLLKVEKYKSVLFNEYNYLLSFSHNYFGAVTADDSFLHEYPHNGLINFPAYNERHYNILNSFVMINKFSENKDMAANLLKTFSSDKNIYNNSYYIDCLLGKDLNSNTDYDTWTDKQLAYLNDVPYLYKNSGIYTFGAYNLGAFINDEIRVDFINGEMSVDKATELIYNKINYIYFE